MQEAKYSTYEVRVRAVNAVVDGMPMTQVAQAYHVDRATVHRWCRRYRERGGNHGLVRRPVPGRPRKLASLADEEFRALVLQPASRFGYETDFWTSGRIQQVLEQAYRIEVSRRTMLRRLREAGLTYQKPEGEYFELSEEERQE